MTLACGGLLDSLCVVWCVSTFLSTEQLDVGLDYFSSLDVTTFDFLPLDTVDLLVCALSCYHKFLVKYVRFANLSLQVAGPLIRQDAALLVTLCFGAVFLECLD